MPATRRETSADSAARFLRARARSGAKSRRKATPQSRVESVAPSRPLPVACCGFRRQARNVVSRGGVFVCAPGKGCGGPGPLRIVCDFAEPTLRAIHTALCDAIAPPQFRPEYTGETLDRILIAEQMVAAALGEPPCDDPPLTDREVTR